MSNGSQHPLSNQSHLNHNNGSPNNWTVNKQIDLLKVLAIFVAAIGAFFTLKSDTEALRDGLSRTEARINKLELGEKDEGQEMARLAVLEAQQRMNELSLGEIKQTLMAIDQKVDDMREEIRGN